MGKTLPFGKIELASLQFLRVAAEMFFRRFAFLDVQTRSIPLDDVAARIAEWHFPVEHPAVVSICSTDTGFVLKRCSGYQAGPPFGHDPIHVLRVNESGPVPAGHFVQSNAQVLQPRLIEVIEVTVRPGGVNQRRDRIDQKLNIQRLGLLFCRGHAGNNTPGESTRRMVGSFPTEGPTKPCWQANRHLWFQGDYGIFYAGRLLRETQPDRNLTYWALWAFY
ncbi:MAG: hypothetical protein WAU89_10595 [Candidatus Acidiferrales bacterium]